MPSARITYLYHSGFAVETENHFMIFDYYMDEVPQGKKRSISEGVLSMADIPKDKAATVFVSHNHGDHFNPVVFKWRKDRMGVNYIISSDVRTRARAIRMSPYEHVDASGLSVDTYGSTDAGVSFAVEADGFSIFHAGDLNLWHWIEESTEAEVRHAKQVFLRELAPLKDRRFDIVMFPVDPRMGRGHDAGAAHFARTMRPGLIIPMHFGDRLDVAAAFAKKMNESGALSWAPESRGDYCDFDPSVL
jgi:L-ascorbate metabolism protein UlaG (beta-lactamase superfamily)